MQVFQTDSTRRSYFGIQDSIMFTYDGETRVETLSPTHNYQREAKKCRNPRLFDSETFWILCGKFELGRRFRHVCQTDSMCKSYFGMQALILFRFEGGTRVDLVFGCMCSGGVPVEAGARPTNQAEVAREK